MKWLTREQLKPEFILHDDQGLLKFATVERDAMLSDSRQVRVVCSTGAVDRENDVISQSGWKLGNYQKNPVVLFGHDYRSLPVARAVALNVEGDKLIMTCEFATPEQNPFADVCYKMVKGGFLNAVSVGFRPVKWAYNEDRKGYDFEQAELLEVSWVPVPAHPQALVEARDAGIDLSLLKQWHDGLGEAFKELEPEVVTDSGDKTVETCKAKFDNTIKFEGEPNTASDLEVDKTAQVIAALIKQGRVLSAANENKIRSAVASLTDVLSALETAPTADDGKADSRQVQKQADPDDIDLESIEFSVDKANEVDFNEHELAALIRDAVREQTRAELTQLTGRVY